MKIIMKPKKSISQIWRGQKKLEGQTYRLMKYVLTGSCEEGILLYNVVTSEMVLLDGVFDISSILSSPYQPVMDELIDKHFAVPVDFNEKKSVDQLRTILRTFNRPKYISGYTIYPTTCCNARCFYCFESDFKKETMTYEIADGVVEYIASHCSERGANISWFGGEPLVGRHIIDYISKKLSEREIPFESSMVSNAYLFDEKVVESAVKVWKLKNIQITLDGTEEEYNRAKAYQNVEGSPYQRVLTNIGLLRAAGISVAVRLNVTQDNVEDLFLLVDELKNRFGENSGLQVYSHLVYDKVGYESFTYTDEQRDALYESSSKLQDKLIQEKLSYGYHKLPHLKEFHCMADNDNSVTIFPNGRIGKCENSSSDDAIGNIYGERYPEKLQLCKEYTEHALCNECALYPYCLNLAVCPEEGLCDELMAKTKIEKYSELLAKKYELYKKETVVEEAEEEDNSSPQCGDEI